MAPRIKTKTTKKNNLKKVRIVEPKLKNKKLYIKGNEAFLYYFSKVNKHKRSEMLKYADNNEIMALIEFIDNVLDNRIQVSEKVKNHLIKGRYANHLRLMRQKSLPLNKRKALLVQHGGFWPLLIPLLSGVLSGVAGALIPSR